MTIGPDEIQGSVTSGNFCNELSGKVGPQKYTLHFDITFDRPFTAHKIITEKGQTGPDAVFLTFNASSDQTVGAKVAISYVNAANAESNWTDEIPGWDVQTVRGAAQAEWNALLGEISVVEAAARKVTQEFYSLLYKDFLQPNIISDVNGQYRGSDFKVHSVSSGHNQYGMFSGWDIYHSLAQLQAMLDPTAASDMAQSLVNLYSQNGILPQWGYLNLDNYAQAGDPSDAVIADYYAFGARNFATTTALNQMLHQASTTDKVRPGTALENKFHYLPQDGSYPCCDAHGYVSSLLEYDNADFALSQYAKALGGHAATAAALQHQANNWTFLFNKANKLLVTRFKSGKFQSGVHENGDEATTSRAPRTSTCGTCRTTTPRCSPSSAASRRSVRCCAPTCPSRMASARTRSWPTSSTSASSSLPTTRPTRRKPSSSSTTCGATCTGPARSA